MADLLGEKVIGFDVALNVARGVGLSMARLADWEVGEPGPPRRRRLRRAGWPRGRGPHRLGAGPLRRPLRGPARLLLASPPGRRRGPDAGGPGGRLRPAHHRPQRRVRRHRGLHRAVQRGQPGADRRAWWRSSRPAAAT
ncbi:hypothetical protein [Nocardioides convexus]|uniref:hypothetical protein n=1 Tax=Nocardioides convexus TaxID=2712224 RepID=UPI002418A79F|nr:hypothetical protein [Nocardioides convexus]